MDMKQELIEENMLKLSELIITDNIELSQHQIDLMKEALNTASLEQLWTLFKRLQWTKTAMLISSYDDNIIMIKQHGMLLGLERDGYLHS